jgi:hypothetical protein
LILRQIASGHLAHADETKGVVYGGGHYVRVFANLLSAAYVYPASRESSLLDDVLAGFKGVLVSDFYGGYDAMPCRQQKCLIHLMRDVNEDVLKHPFNEELTLIAKRFGALLREIVQTIDRYGLKKRHLGKHKRSVERFLGDVTAPQCTTEVSSSLQRRIEKNKDKLFTFIEYDTSLGITTMLSTRSEPSRVYQRLGDAIALLLRRVFGQALQQRAAVQPGHRQQSPGAVAADRQRNVMVTSTPRGTTDYCILLTVQQTLRCRGVNFLDFLRSDSVEIDA